MLIQTKLPDLYFSVSHTTRTPRPKEVDGKDYHFVDRATFERRIEEGAFLEWAEVHNNLYGTGLAEIDRARKTDGCSGMIFDIDYQGARQIRAKQPDVVSVFILPPSMEELLRRLRGRASETEEVVQRRYEVSRREIEHYGFFDYLIVNDSLEVAFDALRAVVVSERCKRWRQASLAETLLRHGRVRS